VVAVHELGKASYEACEHLCEAGCGIYADRPQSCRSFRCEWLRGVLEADGGLDTALRPDACGVVFAYQPESAFGEMYTAWEVEPGASDVGDARDIIAELSERFLVVVVGCRADGGTGPGERRFVGPADRVRQASDAMWSRG
jgi:hypothetical protein